MRIWVWTLEGVVAAGLMLGVTPASAQTTYYADGPNAGGSAALQVQVKASVGGRCGFATGNLPGGAFDQRDFDVSGFTHDFAFQLDCTGPSRVAVVSANGGLKTAGSAPSGYATLAPYDVTVNLAGANNVSVSQTCAVADLAAAAVAACSMRGPASTAAGLRLNASSVQLNGSYLRVSAPAHTGASRLVAGEYQDTLTVTVSAAP